MTGPRHLRSGLVSAALVVLVVVAWLLLAPTRIGGETSYVTTSGVSMQPRFHTGDLAVVRPADHYQVGQIVAYRSTLLHTVVLHRIIARRGDRYVLKGDNNDFVDPTHPTRAEVIGRLSLRVPHGGRVLAWLHTPVVAAGLTGGMALLLLLGAGQQRRRRDRRRPRDAGAGRRGARFASGHSISSAHLRTAFTASAVAAVAFLALGALAFTHPATKRVAKKTPYAEQVSFGYHAQARRGPVYPDGIVKTSDPIFVRLVHRVRVKVHYRLAATAPHRLAGTMEVLVQLTSPTGWSRSVQLAAPTRFTGDYASADVNLDLPALQSLIRRVESQTGAPSGGGYDIAVMPRVHVTGTLASQPLTSDYGPQLSLKLDALQLRAGTGSTGSDNQHDGFTPSRPGAVAASATAPNALSLRGHDLNVSTARWIALLGLLLAAAGALLTGLRQLRQPADLIAHIQARHGHLIVPIAGAAYNAARPPIDVTSIDALVQLAERSERLILHEQRDGADTYLVDDEGTLYRYQARPAGEPQPPVLSVVADSTAQSTTG